mgnify:CR=1 FL=1
MSLQPKTPSTSRSNRFGRCTTFQRVLQFFKTYYLLQSSSSQAAAKAEAAEKARVRAAAAKAKKDKQAKAHPESTENPGDAKPAAIEAIAKLNEKKSVTEAQHALTEDEEVRMPLRLSRSLCAGTAVVRN